MSINIESSFSYLGSLIKKETLKEFKNLGYNSLGLVDNNTAFFLTFYSTLMEDGIKPILGLRSFGKYYDYILYPKNFKGYQEVLYFASSKNMNEVIDASRLVKSSNILYVFDVTHTSSDNIDTIKKEYDELKGENMAVSLGIDFSYYPSEVALYPLLKNDYYCIILDKVKYLKEEDKEASDVLEAIMKGTPLKEANIFDIDENVNYHLLSFSEFEKAYSAYPVLLKNTDDFTREINLEISYEDVLVKYPIKDAVPSNIYLKKLAMKGLEKRLTGTKKDFKTYLERLNYELDVIHTMGFDDYFLIVYDYILYAKKNGILVGPGRGSAASSLVSYSLGIVDIDPMEYHLIFERFLNPQRKTMPDIDTDFEDKRRDDVVRYVVNKYGNNHVALISTFQTFLAKSSIRDVAKVLNISDTKVSLLTKEISNVNSLSDLMKKKSVLNYYEKDPDFKKLLDISSKIEGLPRSIGTHAAGVIISEKDLREYSEVHPGLNGFPQTVFDSDSLKEVGLLKMDFLALKNLSIIHDIKDDIEKTEGVKINLNHLNLSDQFTYSSLQSHSTTGIFQLESPGMADLLKKMKVNSILDLALCIALYRPGPMEQIPLYLKRRNGQAKIDYYDESIKEVLRETLGIIVYQEQTMAVVSLYAGLSLSDADILRRAMSSKDPSLMAEIKERFYLGSAKMNRPLLTTEKLYHDINQFAGYGFNKAHAVSYATIAFTLAYLKAHYPKEFMANLLKDSSSPKYIKECQNMGIKVLPPDLRYSSFSYTVKNGAIYMPYTAIKGIGESYAKTIIEVAQKSDYTFENFVEMSKNTFPRGLIEELIMAGAFDYSSYNKRTMIEALDGLFEFDPSLVQGLNYSIRKTEEYDFDYLKDSEYSLLGFNPKYHPLSRYQGPLKKISDISLGMEGVHLIAYVSALREIKTKDGNYMASLTIEDEFKAVPAVAFPSDYQKFSHYLKKDKIYEFFGSYKDDGRGRIQFIIRNCIEVALNG